jgi:hypothetical protein
MIAQGRLPSLPGEGSTQAVRGERQYTEGVMQTWTATKDGVRVVSPAPRDVWQQLVEADPHACPFQLPEWTDALCAEGKWQDVSRLYEFRSGRAVVLPLVRRNYLTQHVGFEGSLPKTWGYGGAIAADAIRSSELDSIVDDLLHSAPLHLSIRPNPLLADTWSRSAAGRMTPTPRVAHVLDLSEGFEHIWRDCFSGRARRAVRKAERAELTIERGTSGALMSDFYNLYNGWIIRRARERRIPRLIPQMRAEPPGKFSLVGRHLGERCRVLLARLDGHPVAGLILLVYRNSAIYWRGYSDLELTRRTCANNLLQRIAIEEACKEGCRYYDMGESGGVASLESFKEEFGARPRMFAEYSAERIPASRIESWAEHLITRVDHGLARLARTQSSKRN